MYSDYSCILNTANCVFSSKAQAKTEATNQGSFLQTWHLDLVRERNSSLE